MSGETSAGRLGALVLVTVVFYETAKVCLTKGYIHHEEQVAINPRTTSRKQLFLGSTVRTVKTVRIDQFMVNGLSDDGNGFTAFFFFFYFFYCFYFSFFGFGQLRYQDVYYPLHKNVASLASLYLVFLLLVFPIINSCTRSRLPPFHRIRFDFFIFFFLLFFFTLFCYHTLVVSSDLNCFDSFVTLIESSQFKMRRSHQLKLSCVRT